MSAKLPWFKFFASDWIGDGHVRTMTSRQKGWYIDLMAYAWQEGGLPNKLPALRTMTSFYADREYLEMIPESYSAPLLKELCDEFDEIIARFKTVLPDGRITHPRLHKLRQEMEQVNEQKTKAARSRWDAPADAYASSREDASAMHTESIRNAKQEAKKQEAKKPAAAARANGNNLDLILSEAFQSIAEEGIQLPPRYLANEFGREDRNPASERLDRALQRAEPRILKAQKPAALARKIILDELEHT
jgi:hypothetical protein